MKNVTSGLTARTLVLRTLELGERTVVEIAEETGMKYLRVLRHLHLLERFEVVERQSDRRPHRWVLTGLGQRRLA